MNTRIFLVEDNPSDVELVRTAFEELGISVEYAIFKDGDEAIAGVNALLNSTLRPHLVLLDLNLPKTSGHEVLACIRREPSFANVPVVVLSTSNHPVDRTRCLAAGANDYQVKPPHFEQLLDLIQRLRDRWLSGSQ